MRIGLDLINLRSLEDGLGRFARQLVSGLLFLDKKNRYHIFLNTLLPEDLAQGADRFKAIRVSLPRNRFLPWNQAYFALNSFGLPPLDVLHSPVSLSPLATLRPFRKVVTVHDLAYKFYPETCSRRGLWWWNAAWPRCLKKADFIVADSENTKRDLQEIYRVPENKVAVVYPYVSIPDPAPPEADGTLLRSRYHLPERFILYVGAPHKRKNLGTLIKAFRILKEQPGMTHKLVLVGPRGWAQEELLDQIRGLQLENDIIVTGFVPDVDMAFVYRAADVFVYPSLYEGFGYPPLEAMAVGTPVVMSGTSSLPEVGGGAAVYVDPLSPEDMAQKIGNVINSSDLRKSLRTRSLSRSKEFSMARTVEGYLEVYRRLEASGNPRRKEVSSR